jgi:hypothetical protein
MEEQQKELDNLKTRIAGQQTENEALGQNLILTPENTPPEQSLPQSNSAPSLSVQSLPQSNSSPPRSIQSLPQNISAPQAERRTGLPRTERTSDTEILDANNLTLTMRQAVKLFEILQERRTRAAPTTNMVEAQPIGTMAGSNEPLAFLTLAAVERIIGTSEVEIEITQGQTTWNDKVEKCMRLSTAYSSDRTKNLCVLARRTRLIERCQESGTIWLMARCTRISCWWLLHADKTST